MILYGIFAFAQTPKNTKTLWGLTDQPTDPQTDRQAYGSKELLHR